MDEDAPYVRLGRAVKLRRCRRGWSLAAVSAAGGPSHTTLLRIEQAQLDKLTEATLAKLDAGLHWTRGSAAAVIAGGDPTPEEVTAGTVIDTPGAISLSVDELTRLIAVSKQVHAGFDAVGPNPPDAVVTARAAFKDYVSRLVGRYATELLERNGGPGAPLPPILELAFADLLDRPADSDDPAERDEQLYRRWLSGRLDPDKATEQRFRRRWRGENQPSERNAAAGRQPDG